MIQGAAGIEDTLTLSGNRQGHISACRNILIFDQDLDIREMMKYVLSEAGWSVNTSGTVKNVVRRVLEVFPAVILLDKGVDARGAVAAIQEIKLNPATKDIPVVFMSTNIHIDELAKEAGADFTLAKPFDITDLEQVIEDGYKKFVRTTNS